MNVKLERPHFSQPVKATKAAMLARIGELEQQLASEKRAHEIMDAAYWAAKEQLADQTAAFGLRDACIEMIVRAVSPLEGEAVQDAVFRVLDIQTAAKLAVATGLLRVFAECKCCPASFESDAFLADSSQATAQYREALAVVERVRDHYAACLAYESLADAEETITRSELIALLRGLLGDAMQEESPLNPSAGEDAVIERRREMEEKP